MPADLASGAAFGLLLLLAMFAAIVDLRWMIIPNSITLALALSGLVAALLLPSRNIVEALFGVLIGGGGAYVLRVAHRRLRGIEGLGLGDVKFVAAGGAWDRAQRSAGLPAGRRPLRPRLRRAACGVAAAFSGRRANSFCAVPCQRPNHDRYASNSRKLIGL
ncbi:hypothetical protein V1294_006817 [Bradyrhizobium sp. AZCC 1678]|uniref:A24 family peptidase n=1 Tax=Bradyrhizobium sp. AZCC 1678 TaxID=3117030 RepID=UPI002FF335F7